MTVKVYIAASLDGFIADRNGSINWLTGIPTPENDDFGFSDFMASIDAVVMGRKTFETVIGFDPWPYFKPVYVLSRSLNEIPAHLAGKCEIIQGTPLDVVDQLKNRNQNHLYVDGGKTIQGFLAADLVDEMIITRVPVILGGGAPLFGPLEKMLDFEYTGCEVLPPRLQKNFYRRVRKD